MTISGIVGEIYTTETGIGLAEYWPERDGEIAWLQDSPTTRVRVSAVRISHSACVWRREKRPSDGISVGIAH